VATAAIAGMGAFAAPGAARKDRGGSKPRAALHVSDRTAIVGQSVVFDASRSRGDIAYHLWDLDGDNEYETSTKRRARVSHAFSHTGTVRVAVAVFDDHGGYDVQRATVHVVKRPPAAHRAPAATGSHRARMHAATKDTSASKGGGEPSTKTKTGTSSAPAATLHTAATSTSSVTIRDFEFDPKSITVSVGTTVTWTNEGPTAHTATADDGTFDTGNLVKGMTGNYKFTKPGTYKYHCTPHTYMKASVTVTGSGGSPAGDSSSNNSKDSSSGSGKKSSSLPHTGLEIASIVFAGLALLSGGVSLRRRLRRS
jgi:LPXTG-motif cell wall-anchored protein